MKLTIYMVDSNESKTTKSFDNIPSEITDNELKLLANKYKVLTNQVVTTAKKVVTSDIALD